MSSDNVQCTKGIWMSPELKRKENMNTKILFLDCEAIFGAKSDDKNIYNNNHMLFLLFFISSCFVFNTNSCISPESINELFPISNLAQGFNIKVKLTILGNICYFRLLYIIFSPLKFCII